jgi:hypothetical protein
MANYNRQFQPRLGRAWVAVRTGTKWESTALKLFRFSRRLTRFRNARVRCSSHLSGTTFLQFFHEENCGRPAKGRSASGACLGQVWVLWAGKLGCPILCPLESDHYKAPNSLVVVHDLLETPPRFLGQLTDHIDQLCVARRNCIFPECGSHCFTFADIRLGAPEYCVFADMFAFKRQFYLGARR